MFYLKPNFIFIKIHILDLHFPYVELLFFSLCLNLFGSWILI